MQNLDQGVISDTCIRIRNVYVWYKLALCLSRESFHKVYYYKKITAGRNLDNETFDVK